MREPTAKKNSFRRVLVANRGEIALRIIRTLRELEIESVAIYSESDVESLHVSEADYATALRGETPLESYLDIDQVIRAILTSGADAVHPGYGFLAENSHFAEAVASQTGAVFIGPSVEAIRLMGDKVLARQKMLDHDVPVVPGSDGPVSSVEELRSAIKQIGYPVILKAASGGGGRGMRVISDDTQVKSAFESCKREAKLCFGDDSLFCERFVRNPRHIEVQILFDHHGAGVHLFERDCSIQRKHQKVFEEAPSLYLSEGERQQLTTYALRAAKAVDYRGAGTVEFICESPSQVYFMEMNTRIQVEHPVTEMITGIDLIREQILIAEVAISAPSAQVNGQWGAGSVFIFNWDDLDAAENSSAKPIQTITGRSESGAYLGVNFIPILKGSSIHSETESALINKPSKNIDGQWGVGSFHKYALISLAPALPRKVHGLSHNAEFGKSLTATNDLDGDTVSDFLIGSPGGFCEGSPYGSVAIYSVLHQSLSKHMCYTSNKTDLGSYIDFLPQNNEVIIRNNSSLFSHYASTFVQKPDLSDYSTHPTTYINSKSSISGYYPDNGNYRREILVGRYETGLYSNQSGASITTKNKAGELYLYSTSGSTRTLECQYRILEENGLFGKGSSFISDIGGNSDRDIVIGQPGKDVGEQTTGRVLFINGDRSLCSGGNKLDIDPSDSNEVFLSISATHPKIKALLSKPAQEGFGAKVQALSDLDPTDSIDLPFVYIANTNAQMTNPSVIPEYFILKLTSKTDFEIVRYEAGVSDGLLGSFMKELEDINGDGVSEIALSYPGGIGRLGATGHVVIISGKALTTASKEDDVLQMLFSPEEKASNFGVSFDYGDITGDGIKDFVVGANEYDSASHNNAGAVFIFPMDPIKD